ncbi:hypothetical protein E2562_007456, partial [Oryza meyeriana var. granulata]
MPPDMHINLLERQTQMLWVYEGKAMVRRNISYIPALYTMFDRILLFSARIGISQIDILRVSINVAKGRISIYSHGDGLPVEAIPEDINPRELFFHGILSDNINIKKTGADRSNSGDVFTFFSKLIIEISDSGQKYKQVFYENLGKKKNTKITMCHTKVCWTRVTFFPNLDMLNMTHLEDDIVALMRRRVIDMLGILKKEIKVELDGHVLPDYCFPDYVDLYLQSASRERSQNVPRVYQKLNRSWEVCVSLSKGQFEQLSFVNGIATIGGAHIDIVTRCIEKRLISAVKKKSRNAVILLSNVKNHLWVFINAVMPSAEFDSCAQGTLITPYTCLDINFEQSVEFNEFLTQVADSFIFTEVFKWAMLRLNLAMALREENESSELTIEAIPKLHDAYCAGGKDSDKCTLIITEGDSAMSLAMVGLAELGRDYYGVFALKGKLLNVRDASIDKIVGNLEINHIKKIIGLDHTKVYYNTNDLRYGHIMIMTDQDHDGSHIKGLLINFFHVFWPSLLKIPTFLVEFVTPLVKATNRAENSLLYFYTMPEYKSWEESHPGADSSGWSIKYYKGLGTSTFEEGRQYFKDIAIDQRHFIWVDEEDDKAIEIAFSNKQVEERKEWIRNFQMVRELEAEYEHLDKHIFTLGETSPEMLWLRDLDALEKKLDILDQEDEAAYLQRKMRNIPINKGVIEKQRLSFDSNDGVVAMDELRVQKQKVSKEALPCQNVSSCLSDEKAYKNMALQSRRNASTSSIRSPSKDIKANVPSERKYEDLLNDLRTLQGRNWLNDGVICRIFKIFSETICNNKILLVPQGVSTLLSNPLYYSETVKNLELPSYSLVLIPVNDAQENPNPSADAGSHWSLLVLDMTRADTPMFHHHDSLGTFNWEVAKCLAEKIKVLPAVAKAQICNVPVLQQDSYNCGVYVLAIAEAICEWFVENQEYAHISNYNSFMKARINNPKEVHEMRKKYINMILNNPGSLDS